MSKSVSANKVKSGGRPEKYGAVHVKIFKEVVRTMGLAKGCDHLRKKGIIINNKLRKLDISVSTLSKYVQREDPITGEAVILKRGYRQAPDLVYNLSEEDEKAFDTLFDSDLDDLILEEPTMPVKDANTMVATETGLRASKTA